MLFAVFCAVLLHAEKPSVRVKRVRTMSGDSGRALMLPYMRQICFATYEVTFNHCMEDGCKEHLLAASEFQEKVVAHYLADGVPPLREAYILATLPQDFIQNIAEECPPVVFFAYLLIAEATSVVDVAESQPFLVSAVSSELLLLGEGGFGGIGR